MLSPAPGLRRTLRSALRIALPCLALGACALPGEQEADSQPERFVGDPEVVLETASELLASQGYDLAELDAQLLELQGERTEVATRGEGSLSKGTVVSQQVVVDASADGDATMVTAVFTVVWRRPTGERRVWVPESSLGVRLRDRFYAELHRALGDAEAPENAPVSAPAR